MKPYVARLDIPIECSCLVKCSHGYRHATETMKTDVTTITCIDTMQCMLC